MPKIPPLIRDCVIYLYRTAADARDGIRSGASGFLVGVRSEYDPTLLYPYAVTCRHVIEGADALTIRINTASGSIDPIETTIGEWQLSPTNDIAIRPMQIQRGTHLIRVVPQEMFLTEALIDKHAIGIGDDVFLVGRLIDQAGKQRNTPSARFGNIALLPCEKVENSFLKRDVEAFLCEVKSIGGFSGSPVFVFVPSFSQRFDGTPLDSKPIGPFLLGVDSGHCNVLQHQGKPKPNPDRNTGIATVAPAWELSSMLDKDRPRRAKLDQEMRRRRDESATELDSEAWPESDHDDPTQSALSAIERAIGERLVPPKKPR